MSTKIQVGYWSGVNNNTGRILIVNRSIGRVENGVNNCTARKSGVNRNIGRVGKRVNSYVAT